MISKTSEKWIDTRNVVDKYKNLSNEEIKNDLKSKHFPFAVLMENWKGDYNFSTLVRNANAFNAKEVFYLSNKKKYDKRGAVGTYNYTDVKHLKSLSDLEALKEKYVFIGVDNIRGSVSMNDFRYPNNTLFIFGEEGTGLTEDIQKMCSNIVHIPQFGSVRSLNAGTASGIIMYDFTRKACTNNDHI